MKNILILGALGVGAFLLLRKKSSSTVKDSPLPPPVDDDRGAPKVGIAGCTIGSIYRNIDSVTSMYGIGSIYEYNNPKGITYCNDKTYSDAAKGACSYHGGAAEVKLIRNLRSYNGKGQYSNYSSYRKNYKSNWAKMNRADKVVTL